MPIQERQHFLGDYWSPQPSSYRPGTPDGEPSRVGTSNPVSRTRDTDRIKNHYRPSRRNFDGIEIASKKNLEPERTSITIGASRKLEQEKRSLICKTWDSKQFSDVNIFCGMDGRVIKASRLFLSGLSRYLCKIFLEHDSFFNEDVSLVIPDVDSRTLSGFLRNVCSGQNSLARIEESLKFLEFGDVTDSEMASDPNHQEPMELEEDARPRSSPANETMTSFDNEDSDLTNGDETSFGAQDRLNETSEERISDEDKSRVLHDNPKMARKRGSLAWKFFRILEVNDHLGECSLCKEVVPCSNGTTSSMLKHLRKAHVKDYSEALAHKIKQAKTEPVERKGSRLSEFYNHQEPEPSDWAPNLSAETSLETSDVGDILIQDNSNLSKDGGMKRSDGAEKPKINRRKISSAWLYFNPLDDSEAQCTQCEKIVPTIGGTTSGLLKHLKRHHSSKDITSGSALKQKKKLGGKQTHRQLSTSSESSDGMLEMRPEVFSSSPVWTIFKLDDSNSSSSRCSLCSMEISASRGSTVPLIDHIHKSHASTFETFKPQLEDPNLPVTYDPSNPLWRYFITADEKFAECLNCSRVCAVDDNGTSDLTNHLESDHQEIHLDYLRQCTQWRLQRKEEFLTFKSSLEKLD